MLGQDEVHRFDRLTLVHAPCRRGDVQLDAGIAQGLREDMRVLLQTRPADQPGHGRYGFQHDSTMAISFSKEEIRDCAQGFDEGEGNVVPKPVWGAMHT